tara:strand:+ start:85 stop:303 length:219 start_codon:yes stop_codon:yes gene_type:complete
VSDARDTSDEQAFDEAMEREVARMRSVSFGPCLLCGDAVTEYDITYGVYGGEWRGDNVYHVVCLSGKLAVAV